MKLIIASTRLIVLIINIVYLTLCEKLKDNKDLHTKYDQLTNQFQDCLETCKSLTCITQRLDNENKLLHVKIETQELHIQSVMNINNNLISENKSLHAE